jgi:hypothetical protein
VKSHRHLDRDLSGKPNILELVSLMIREEDLKARTAEDALERIHQQVGDMSEVTEEADDMFVPLEE